MPEGVTMKSFQTKTAVAFLIVAGGIVPAFGQGRGHGERGNGGQGRSDRSAQEGPRGQMRGQQARPQAAPPQERGKIPGGGGPTHHREGGGDDEGTDRT